MPIVTTNFVRGRMNKSVDERLLPPGEYVNAINVRLGSTETTEIGAVENSKGNTKLTTLQYEGADLTNATCIGAYDDGANETIYWFIHDSNQTLVSTGKADLIVSFNTKSQSTEYHIVSFKNSEDTANTTLNFNPSYLITEVNKVDNLLFFTDNYNPPRKINVNKSYEYPTALNANDSFNEINKKVPQNTFSKGNINQQINYLEFPLEISYKLLDRKLGVTLIGGVSTFILTKNQSSVAFENEQSRDFGDQLVNVNSTVFSNNLGLGIQYQLTKNLKLNVEPTVKVQWNAFNNQSDFRPYILGIYTGLSLHL